MLLNSKLGYYALFLSIKFAISHMRKKWIVGNWKMHKTPAEAKAYFEVLPVFLQKNMKARVLIAVPFPILLPAFQMANHLGIEIGAQNMHEMPSGAFTGEVSCEMIQDCGGSFVLLGHSERRQLFQESDASVHRKLKRALSCGLQPIVCIGETQEERNLGLTQRVLLRQIEEGFGDISSEEASKVILAYEPVWAIGTGSSATPDMAQEVHSMCRQMLKSRWGDLTASQIPILYGGSVKPENVRDLMQEEDIDGVLVGGASLDAESFAKIIYY